MAHVYKIFLKGLFTVLPITITLYVLVWLTATAEGLFGGPLQALIPPSLYFPGLGVALGLALVFMVGVLVNNYLAAKLVTWIENAMQAVPFVKTIYNPLRDIMGLFARNEKSLSRVVLVTLPNGLSLMGLVTRDRFQDLPRAEIPEDSLAVFVPYSYAVGGFTLLVPRSMTKEISIPAEKAMQLAITAWVKTEKAERETGAG